MRHLQAYLTVRETTVWFFKSHTDRWSYLITPRTSTAVVPDGETPKAEGCFATLVEACAVALDPSVPPRPPGRAPS